MEETWPVSLTTADGETLDITCGNDQTVVDAAADSGLWLPSLCRQGTCGSCRGTVKSGEYELGTHNPDALPPGNNRDVLLCRTVPRGPITIDLPYSHDRILLDGIRVHSGKITELSPVTRDVVRLVLHLDPSAEGTPGSQFDAGQFVQLEIPNRDVKRSYSMCNTGNWDGRLEFLIRLRPGGAFSSYLRDEARAGHPLVVHGPQGAFGLHETGLNPRWFIAGGTGLGPLLSMARRMAEWQDPQPARLLLGVNEESDVFGTADLDAIRDQLPDFAYDICVWHPTPTWAGRHGTPAEIVRNDLRTTPAPPDIYVCGPPPLVDSIIETATACGIAENHIFFERYLPN
ncbi:FAD-binding oxidoreductase [Streptoalloteichus hindustanus]|uniref:Ferredoxin-NADP reductase n=1 Tax=Streptoalloteichus hindustanus TaxID=2017 RepID=A0A1M5F1R1_STRHI|nr:2Fe-2S iron-sulfur cluster binding domain-containing protein [Streptoalloteichus hindustanus]SHF85181.1 Ferredoxin-NADP reductase [Streptoalloteichus hindustanus]